MMEIDSSKLGTGLAPASSRAAMGETVSSASAAVFPEGFVWGAATAAYQIEGAVNEDGRGPTIWDEFSHTPGKTFENHTGDTACDSYRRYREDTQLLKALDVRAYRFSVAWSRIFPEGRGRPNAKGIDHYKRVIDDLLQNGIEPFVTLFHWDLPSALPGGWQNRDTAEAFADYAEYMAEQLSDRVRRFVTLNELRSFTDLGHKTGMLAPGLKLPTRETNQVRHNALLAHGLATKAIRAAAHRPVEVGLADNLLVCAPIMDTPEHVAAAKRGTRDVNAMFLTTVMEGSYPAEYIAAQGADAPRVQEGDMAAIGSPLDFLGLNLYTPLWVRADASPSGYAIIPRVPSSPHMASSWLVVGPEVAYWGVRQVSELWKPKALYITENGASVDDVVTSGRVDDADRVMYLRNHLAQFQRAVAEGHPLKGYFVWSLLDNFEWMDGYGKRFGIHYVDFETQRRTPKLSAEWYKEVIRRNQVI